MFQRRSVFKDKTRQRNIPDGFFAFGLSYVRLKMECKDYILAQKTAIDALRFDPKDSELNMYAILAMGFQGNLSMAQTYYTAAKPYTDADGNLIRLTRDDFSNEEEFLRWKKISDMDYHGEEKVDHLYYDGTLPLESLAEEVIAVPSAEEGYITEIDLSERHLLENLLLEGMGTKLTERQRTRLWLYCINGVTAAEIASFEGIAQQNVSKSIASAKKKLKKFLKNRV